MKTKIDNFLSALPRLRQAVADHAAYPVDTMRDGVIQRFEFTFELAWKSLKEYMEDQGVQGLQFPKQVLREAYAARIIDHEEIWLSMLADRNTTSHIYDDRAAANIFSRIEQQYLPEFDTLAARLSP